MTTWTTFLGWATLLHLVAYALSVLTYWIAGHRLSAFYARHIGISEDEFRRLWVGLVGGYKILIWTFFAVPYLVLRLFL